MSMRPKHSAVHWNCLLMSKNSLDVLKKGLSKLKNSVKESRDNLLAFLNRKEKISDEDEEWLDNASNVPVVDEEAVVDDYERGLTRLTSQKKILPQGVSKEIFRSVQDMAEAEQMIEVNGGDDIDMETVQVKPTTVGCSVQVYASG